MNTLANLGLSAATVSTLSQESIAQITEDPTKEVPFVKGYIHRYPNGMDSPPEIETVHSTIPYGRWARIQSTYDAANKVSSLVDKIDRSSSINVGVRYHSNSPQQVEPSVLVSHDTLKKPNGEVVSKPNRPFEELERELPAHVDGTVGGSSNTETIKDIPIVMEKNEKRQQAYYDDTYRPCPGGCQVSVGSSLGTITFSFWDYDVSRRRFMTSGHVINHNGSPDGHAYQPEYNEALGYPVSHKTSVTGELDAGLIDPRESDVKYTNKLAEDDGTYSNNTVNKVHGWDWIANEGYNTFITHQGRTSGRPGGYVKNTVTKDGKRNFWTEASSEGGDSGGPHYHYDSSDDYYWLVGIHNWTHDGTDSGGIALEKVQNDYNLAL